MSSTLQTVVSHARVCAVFTAIACTHLIWRYRCRVLSAARLAVGHRAILCLQYGNAIVRLLVLPCSHHDEARGQLSSRAASGLEAVFVCDVQQVGV